MGRMVKMPELELVAAVLTQAVVDLSGHGSHPHQSKARLRMDAEHWVEEMSDDPWGFAWCCRVLGLDPEAIAPKLLAGVPMRRVGKDGRVHKVMFRDYRTF